MLSRYYFRVRNMESGVTYTFNIINLMKADSLYNYGGCENTASGIECCSVYISTHTHTTHTHHTHSPHTHTIYMSYVTRLVYFAELY